jgi:hypothetical protein
MDIR